MIRELHQIWIGDPAKIPPYAIKNCRDFNRLHPGWRATLWLERDIELLIAEQFPDVCARWVLCKDWTIARADLARLCIVASRGGLYADLDIEWYKNIEPLVTKPAVFFKEATTGYVTNSIFYSGANITQMQPLINCTDKCPRIANTHDVLEFAGPLFLTKHVKENDHLKIRSHIYFEYPDELNHGRQDFQYGHHKYAKTWMS